MRGGRVEAKRRRRRRERCKGCHERTRWRAARRRIVGGGRQLLPTVPQRTPESHCLDDGGTLRGVDALRGDGTPSTDRIASLEYLDLKAWKKRFLSVAKGSSGEIKAAGTRAPGDLLWSAEGSSLDSRKIFYGMQSRRHSRAGVSSGESRAVVTREQGRPPGRVLQSLLESKDVIRGEPCNPNSRARMQSGESHAVVTREQGCHPGRVVQS